MENFGNNILSLIIGLGTLAFLREIDFKEEGGIIGYVIVLFFSSAAWISLFTGTGESGLIGNINFVIMIIQLRLVHSDSESVSQKSTFQQVYHQWNSTFSL